MLKYTTNFRNVNKSICKINTSFNSPMGVKLNEINDAKKIHKLIFWPVLEKNDFKSKNW